MSGGFQGNRDGQSIRPSLASLTDATFFEKLEVEANQLRNLQGSRSDRNALPVIPSTHLKPKGPKPPAKKSQFARQKEAALKTHQPLHDDLPVPTGRFELELDSEKTDDINGCEIKNSDRTSKIPLIAEVTERHVEALDPSNGFFDSSFSQNAFLEKNPPKSGSSINSSIPPWEARRLTSRNSSEKPQPISISKAGWPDTHVSSCSGSADLNTVEIPFSSTEKQRISSENQSLLAKMSEQDIFQEQAELKAHLMQSNPELLTKLLTKLNIKAPTDQVLSDTPHTTTPSSKKSKHVRYTEEDEIFPCDPSPSQTIPTHVPVQDNTINSDAMYDSPEPLHLTFDWKGVRVADGGAASAHHPSIDGIHIHQTSAFNLKQLLQLILSSVPAQRIMGLKILTQIVTRYLGSSANDMDNSEMALLTDEFKSVGLDILLVASQATCERNIGITTSALALMNSIFSTARDVQTCNPTHKCLVQPAWIEHLLTQTTLLADFHSKFEHQELPRPSMTSIVQILRDMVALGESSKVSEEIVKMPSFLELIVQVLVAVPWPMSSKQHSELPDLSTFELLLVIAKSSRACSRSMLDRGLLTPTLRFLGLPYWSLAPASDQDTQTPVPFSNDHIMGVFINSMSFQFQLMTVFAGYGLGTSLRTTLDPLLRTTTVGLHKILETSLSETCSNSAFVKTQEFNLISSYLNLLAMWMRCADDPHFTDPPHSITWSQVSEWESIILDFLRLSSMPSLNLPGKNKVLASACDLIVLYIGTSYKKNMNIGGCLARLDSLMPQLQSIFQATACTLLESCSQKEVLKPELSECHLLISFAKLKTCITRISSGTENQPLPTSRNFAYNFTDDVFGLGCRMAFEDEDLSLLPWALVALDLNCKSNSTSERLLLAGLFVRNSDGIIVREILEETLRQCQSRMKDECRFSNETSVQDITPQLSQLLHIFVDYINHAGTSTQVSDPSPHQIRNQAAQDDKAAFLLPSTWPLLAVACLKPEHLSSAAVGSQINGFQIRTIEIARASYGSAVILQSSLNDLQIRFETLSDVFHQLLSGQYSVWKAVLESAIATSAQAYWTRPEATGDQLWSSIFDDPMCSRLALRLIRSSPPSHLRSLKPQATLDMKPKSEMLKAQEAEEAELYTIFTEILAIFDSSLVTDTFMNILTPFLSMTRAREFRGGLFDDHPRLIKNMLPVSLDDVLNIHNRCDEEDRGIDNYFNPVENNPQILHKFAGFLTTEDVANMQSPHRSFLFKYLIHHVSTQCWNSELDERVRLDLLKTILGRTDGPPTRDHICQLVLGYEPSISLSQRLSSPPEENKHDDDLDRRTTWRSRSQWLQSIFARNENTGDQNRWCLDRLRDLRWVNASSSAPNLHPHLAN